MLTKISIETARVLADILDKKGVKLTPEADLPLEKVVIASRDPMERVNNTLLTEGELNKEGDVVKVKKEPHEIISEYTEESLAIYSLSPVYTTPNTHDDEMSNLTSNVIQVMDRRLTLARTVIDPTIKKYVDSILRILGDKAPVVPEVVPHALDDFYTIPMVKEIFTGYGKIGADVTVPAIKGVDTSEQFYLAPIVNPGNNPVSVKLKSIYDTRGEEWYTGVVNKYFNSDANVQVLSGTLNEDYLEQVDENLVAHMVARQLYNEETPRLLLEDGLYEKQLTDILSRTANNIMGMIDYKNLLDDKGTVVLHASMESNQIHVYYNNYVNYIKRGGNAMRLAGYNLTKRGAPSVESLLENGDELENAYDKDMKRRMAEMRLDAHDLTIDAARKTLGEVVAQLVQHEFVFTIPELNTEEDITSVLMKRGYDYINNNSRRTDDIFDYASDIVLLGLLPELGLHIFYENMQRYITPKDGSPGLPPAQAAYYATLDELVTYFLSQVSVSSK